ncbi:MAG: cellulose biosynthesis cyclic di-GMP-binding regulatory protein BcsB [Elainellaceae cyanobacterium]
MFRLPFQRPKRRRDLHSGAPQPNSPRYKARSSTVRRLWFLPILGLILAAIASFSLWSTPSIAQSNAQGSSLEQQENQVIQQFKLPRAQQQRPVYRPRPAPARRAPSRSSSRQVPRPAAPARASTESSSGSSAGSTSKPAAPAASESASKPDSASETSESDTASAEEAVYDYQLNFSRSPVVGNRLRLQGVYPEARLGFTRPRHWDLQSAKAIVRYQHSPTLLGDRSYLTLRVNNTSLGSVPLDQPNSQIAEAVFDIPVSLIQDYNDLSMVAVQHTSETCTNPANPSVWTEVMPDSELLFEFKSEPVALDLGQFPYPFIDPLSLDPNSITYLAPKAYTDVWATAASRFQIAAARMAERQPLQTTVVDQIDALDWGDHLVIIGTPEDQPLLAELSLPFTLKDSQILDQDDTPLPNDAGLLILTSVKDGAVPALIATGNDAAGVAKAVQLLTQPSDRQILTGQTLLVSNVTDVASSDGDWPGFLPSDTTFQLADLMLENGESFQDVTVQGATPPVIRLPFKSPPDQRYLRGSTMTLNYSYSRQVNPRTSAIEVKINDVSVGSRRLDDWRGGRKSFTLELPPALIRPDSVLTVNFILDPRDSELCGPPTDGQLWGTLHGDTSFNLKHDTIFELPNLKLLTAGFPLAAPQDLSNLAIALPDAPTAMEVDTLMALSKRLGQISSADAVKLVVTTGQPSAEVNNRHVVGIGRRDRFPLSQALQEGDLTFNGSARRLQGSQVQSASSYDGIIKAITSGKETRTIVALTAETEAGLGVLQDVLNFDRLFFQLEGDTVLVNRIAPDPQPYDPGAYQLTTLNAVQHQRVQNVTSLRGASLFLQQYWFLIPTGIVLVALLLYGISQLYVNRVSRSQEVR